MSEDELRALHKEVGHEMAYLKKCIDIAALPEGQRRDALVAIANSLPGPSVSDWPKTKKAGPLVAKARESMSRRTRPAQGAKLWRTGS